MPRIAKSDVNAALSTVARALVTASGPDGRTSRADVQAALKTLPKEQRPLADIFFKFVDQRDFKTGAQVTAKDINKAVAYAKQHMIAKYDLNSNGLSKGEIARMSLTGKRAVELAKALKAAGVADDGGGKLDSRALATEVAKHASTANYMSESDYSPEFVAAPLAAGQGVTGNVVMSALAGPLKKLFEGSGAFPGDYAIEQYSAKDAKAFIEDLRTDNRDEPRDEITESAEAFGAITRALEANLTDLKVFNVGPKEEGGTGVASDQGLYGRLIVGRSTDGKLVGILIGAVET